MVWISENSPHNTFAGYLIFMQHPCVGPVTKTVSDFCQVKEIKMSISLIHVDEIISGGFNHLPHVALL